MSKIDKINVIKQFTNREFGEVTYGVYSVDFNGRQEIFIRNGDSVATVTFPFGEPACKCLATIRDDVRKEFLDLLKAKEA